MNAVGDTFTCAAHKVTETCFGDTCDCDTCGVPSPKVSSSSRLKVLPLPPADPERPGNWALTIRLLPQVGQRAATFEYAQKCIFLSGWKEISGSPRSSNGPGNVIKRPRAEDRLHPSVGVKRSSER